MDIAGKTIVITGANRGIGRALVEEALRRDVKRVYAGTRGAFAHDDFRVTRLALDVTSPTDIARAAHQVDGIDLLINNAGVCVPDALDSAAALEAHLAVNLFGVFNVTNALLPRLTRPRSAILNILSLAAIAAVPIMPAYSLSKAAAFNLTQTLRMRLAGQGISVHGAMIGPVDTDMTRGLELPKTPPAVVAQGIFDGLARGEEDIFPDPVAQSIADPWRNGATKALEREFAAFAQ